MADWVKYEGTDEQIEEILYAGGYIIRTNTGYESGIRMAVGKRDELISELNDGNVTHYLICQKHPLADMIERQARTGQPVWIKTVMDMPYAGLPILDERIQKTNKPDWNIPGAEYSFYAFEEEK